MEQLRIYTLATSEAANQYFTKHWTAHIKSLKKFGITTKNVLLEKNTTDVTRIFAIVSYEPNADLDEVTKAYMASPEFKSDMEGFDFNNFIKVEELPVEESSYL